MKHYGILGYPLGHTMSPPIHQALFALYACEADYQIFEIPPEQLEARIPELFALDGFNITIPHKVEIRSHLDDMEEKARIYGSVNVVKCGAEKIGYNTDVIGFTKSVEQLGASLSSRVLLLGCGGVGRMIAIETALRGGDLIIAVRSSGVPLAEKVREEIRSLRPNAAVQIVLIDRIAGTYDLMVNATPAGMYPNIDASPVGEPVLTRVSCFFDLIYNPIETKLMRLAKQHGVRTLGGMSMLVWQAAAAHEIWNGASFRQEDIIRITKEMERRLLHA